MAHQELTPKFLDKDVYLMEMNSWVRDFKSYIDMGYNGWVPKKNLYIQLRPLLHESWKSLMDALDPEKQNLEQLCEALLEEDRLRMPRH